MPTYEYKCTECDGRFEVEQSFTDDALTSLPGCDVTDDGDHRLKKVFSAVGIAFKGEGFYRNDARSPGRSSTSSSGDTGSGSTPASDSSAGDSTTSGASTTSSSTKTGADSGSSTPATTAPAAD